ncbi:MAG: hypothetical protein ABI035_07120 [Gemmatimonadaceae bacterium]
MAQLNHLVSRARPVSVLMIHGTADENLPYNGGVGSNAHDRHDVKPVSYAVDSWRKSDRCMTTPVVTKSGEVTSSVWSGCADSTLVELLTIDGGGHSWPGAPRLMRATNPPNDALDATRTAWNFFLLHPRLSK